VQIRGVETKHVPRPATSADQPAIKAIVRGARLNPYSLDWPRFLVVAEGARVVGVGQVKPHRDGSRELASIAIVPERQGLGIGGDLVRALIERESGVLYLLCEQPRETFYERFGFQRIQPREMPPYFRRIYRLGTTILALLALVRRDVSRLSVMRREAGPLAR
jgi:N-acetylglutamate synthase-like GNAT family acetyltransferase